MQANGLGKTQSITNTLIFEKITAGKRLKVLFGDDALRALIWTHDASMTISFYPISSAKGFPILK